MKKIITPGNPLFMMSFFKATISPVAQSLATYTRLKNNIDKRKAIINKDIDS